MDKGTLKQEAYETKISWTAVTNIILIIVFICVFFFGFLRKGGSGATNFTKSRARLNENTKNVTFKDVAGADEEKAELEMCIRDRDYILARRLGIGYASIDKKISELLGIGAVSYTHLDCILERS